MSVGPWREHAREVCGQIARAEEERDELRKELQRVEKETTAEIHKLKLQAAKLSGAIATGVSVLNWAIKWLMTH